MCQQKALGYSQGPLLNSNVTIMLDTNPSTTLTPSDEAYLRITKAISQLPERYKEVMGNPQILILLRSICQLFPDTRVDLSRGQNVNCNDSLEASANCWGIGAEEGFNGEPISLLNVSYLLGWKFGAGSTEKPGPLHPETLLKPQNIWTRSRIGETSLA